MNRVFHIISGLNQGGAESILFRLCLNTDDSKFQHIVVSLTTFGIYGNKLLDAGIKVYCLHIQSWYSIPSASYSLFRLIRSLDPSVVQTWMYHSDLFGGIIARLAGVNKIVWNIRGPLNKEKTSFRTFAIAKISAILSTFIPSIILCCSEHARKVHVNIGYCSNKFFIIPNGYNYSVQRYKEIEFKINDSGPYLINDPPVIGMVARYDPFKDHENLIKALSHLKRSNITFKCLLIGEGLSDNNFELTSFIRSFGLEDDIILLGHQTDTNAIFQSINFHVLSSLDEAFPNVLAEAMACGTPCVTTDVGDASLIVGTTGWIVPAKDSSALAEGIKLALNELREKSWLYRQKSCIERVNNNFSLAKMIMLYEKVWLYCGNNSYNLKL